MPRPFLVALEDGLTGDLGRSLEAPAREVSRRQAARLVQDIDEHGGAIGVEGALRLGDISLLSGDIDWVKGLLVYANVPKNELVEFLQIYQQAVFEILGQDAEIILNWFQKEIKRLKQTQ